MKRYLIRTFDYGDFWRHAKSVYAAKARVARELFGNRWRDSSAAWVAFDHWETEEK